MVQLKGRYILIALMDSKESAAVTARMLQSLRPCRGKVETITFENGKEFARHAPLAE